MGWAIALHGGAGDISKDLPVARKEAAEACLQHCLDLGVSALQSSRTALDVVELVVRELESNPVFNAGRGSVLTTAGTVEMEACIMDGPSMNCGAVSGLSTVVHPITLARLVMEKTPHVYLAFEGAEDFARKQHLNAKNLCPSAVALSAYVQGMETKEPTHFITKENQDRLARAHQEKMVQLDYTQHSTTALALQNSEEPAQEPGGVNNSMIQNAQFETVGCVAVDDQSNCAAATSTGVGEQNGRTNRGHSCNRCRKLRQ